MATATPYISGMKKPLNMLENPVYPDIKKGPPRFVWSRKHWNVDEGATLRETEPYTQFIEPAILTQSRDYNRTVYGQTSFQEKVNAEFRPPLLSYYEDIGPLSRVPATIHAIIPHINPSTAGHDGGTSSYTAKNQRTSDVVGALTDRIKNKEWRPTFYAPMEIPRDNSVLPDLEAKLPPISIHAGWNIPIFTAYQPPEPDLGDEKFTVPLDAGKSSSIRIDGPSGYENYELYENRPQVSVDAGVNTPMHVYADVQHPEDLPYNRPQVSVGAGMNTPVHIYTETRVEDLPYNRPQVSAGAGMNTPMHIDAETPTSELFTKLGATSIKVLNPGSESGYKEQVSMYSNPSDNIRDNRPRYSYTVPSEVPAYRTRNESTHQPHFRERLQAEKSYGQIAQSGGTIPRMGIDQPRMNLGGRNKFASERKKAIYRF